MDMYCGNTLTVNNSGNFTVTTPSQTPVLTLLVYVTQQQLVVFYLLILSLFENEKLIEDDKNNYIQKCQTLLNQSTS